MTLRVILFCATILLPASAYADVLASWTKSNGAGSTFSRNTLSVEDGRAVLRMAFSDGSGLSRTVAEVPSNDPALRRFVLEPDYEWSEYFTLSESGAVLYYDFDGEEFARADAMLYGEWSVKEDVPEPECVPKELSDHSAEIVHKYDDLRWFKDDWGFRLVGFAQPPYKYWADELWATPKDEAGEVMRELYFGPVDLAMLGLAYERSASGRETEADPAYIEDAEREIRASLSAVLCVDEATADLRAAARG